jgi:hypothetical protein
MIYRGHARGSMSPSGLQFVPAIVQLGLVAVNIWFSSSVIVGNRGDPIMQFQQANTEKHGLAEAAASQLMQPAGVYPWDFLSPNRDRFWRPSRPGDGAPFDWSQAHWSRVLDWDGSAALVGMVLQI